MAANRSELQARRVHMSRGGSSGGSGRPGSQVVLRFLVVLPDGQVPDFSVRLCSGSETGRGRSWITPSNQTAQRRAQCRLAQGHLWRRRHRGMATQLGGARCSHRPPRLTGLVWAALVDDSLPIDAVVVVRVARHHVVVWPAGAAQLAPLPLSRVGVLQSERVDPEVGSAREHTSPYIFWHQEA